MGILKDSRDQFEQARARIEGQARRKYMECIGSGSHHISKASLHYKIGVIQSVIPYHGRIGILVGGECPNCHTYCERPPTNAEIQTPEYQQMLRHLETPESVDKKLNTPMRI